MSINITVKWHVCSFVLSEISYCKTVLLWSYAVLGMHACWGKFLRNFFDAWRVVSLAGTFELMSSLRSEMLTIDSELMTLCQAII